MRHSNQLETGVIAPLVDDSSTKNIVDRSNSNKGAIDEYLGVAIGVFVTLIFLTLAVALVLYSRKGAYPRSLHNQAIGSHFVRPQQQVDLLGDITPPTIKRAGPEEAIYAEPFHGGSDYGLLLSAKGLSASGKANISTPTSTILSSGKQRDIFRVFREIREKRREDGSLIAISSSIPKLSKQFL